MKLHEAIRLGSMLRPQCIGHYQTPWGTCAIGAAVEAGIGSITFEDGSETFNYPDALDALLERSVACPGCGDIEILHDVITCLNDNDGWTREEIADFVQTVEETAEQPKEQKQEVSQ